MSKLTNWEVVSVGKWVVLEAENGSQIEIDAEHLPSNLKEGRFLRFVISHTDYNLDDEYEYEERANYKGVPEIPKGNKLAW